MNEAWAPVPEGSGYDLNHLPYGVFALPGELPRVGARIGDHVLDLAAALGGFEFLQPSLNAFMAQGPAAWHDARGRIVEVLTDPGRRAGTEPALHPLEAVELRLPFTVADYVDFYASESHAGNVGRMFRPGSAPLPSNWKHLPNAYHGRSGTVVVSGTPVVRPRGQRTPPSPDVPGFGPTAKLDVECEVGFVVGAPSPLGARVPGDRFAEHVFGVCLLNDWSARDVQAWESVPLGPFLGKSFATSVSAWITPVEALQAARVPTAQQEPRPLDYLRTQEPWALDLALSVALNGQVISRPAFAQMYWSPAQMLAHLTVNGACLRTGDLFASGTVSGPSKEQQGCLLELTWNGAEPLTLNDGTTRAFLEDGDTVTLTGTAPGAHGPRISLGEVTGRVIAAS